MAGVPDELVRLAGEDWAEALTAAPREAFVPDVAWSVRDGMVDRGRDPAEWAAAVALNDAIVTQVADGEVELTAESVRRNPHLFTSSCSAPSLVFGMLRLLDPYPGDRVLEVGTGTGWTAALLSARLGAENVTSIEVDPGVAERAGSRLSSAGFVPRLVVGDGSEGWPDDEPYDRVHVTCGVHTVPHAWVEQTRPGGVIVVPWSPSIKSGHHLARLTVAENSAVGTFHGEAAFMPLRAQRDPLTPIHGEVRHSRSDVDPRRIGRSGAGFEAALAGLLPGVAIGGNATPNPVDGTLRLFVQDRISDSHAIAIQSPTQSTADVRERGPRDLWRELESAYLAWVLLGEPGMERLGLRVTPTGQHVWLDTPTNPITEVIPHG